MAQKKKKTKVVANPARGFATTSTPSKPRIVEGDDDTASSVPPVQGQLTEDPKQIIGGVSYNVTTSNNTAVSSSATKQLTPEEYEQQLEEDELRRTVDQFAAKSKRDSSRQINRLRTERRLLRSQSGELYTRTWVPEDLVRKIIAAAAAEPGFECGENSITESASNTKKAQISEQELSVAVWTLQRTLSGLRFRKDRVDQVLCSLIKLRHSINPCTFRDGSWGLDEAFELLAFGCELDELSYEEQDGTADAIIEFPAEPSNSSTRVSGAATPVLQKNGNRIPDDGARLKDDRVPVPDLHTEQPYEPISDLDPDVDPKQLSAIYLRTKARLYKIDPRSFSGPAISRNQKKTIQGSQNTTTATTQTTRLLSKLAKIEGDILFDKYETDRQWMIMQPDLDEDLAVERKLARYLQENDSRPKDAGIDLSNNNRANRRAKEGDEDNGLGLEELFEASPTEELDEETGKVKRFTLTKDGLTILIRDFGNWTGLSPRRALEELCKQRDPKTTIKYHPLFTSAFSNRDRLEIRWSRPVPGLVKSTLCHFGIFSSTNSISVEMLTVSTTSKLQAEAMVSCAALYLLSLSSSKDEKLYLRLPSTWRALWSEFAEERRGEVEEADMRSLSSIKTLICAEIEKGDSALGDDDTEERIMLPAVLARRKLASSQIGGPDMPSRKVDASIVSEGLRSFWTAKSSTPAYQKMLQSRMKLPMWTFKNEVVDALEREQLIIICGETGCGKSTQVPSYILEHELSNGRDCKIYCTEPRRISAISLAKRVSEELGEQRRDLGTNRSLVGYAIRLESNTSSETKLTFATTGIVMRMLESSNSLPDVTHLLLDEVHERTIDSDFLLIVLRKLMRHRPDLKVVLMSATVDAERFQAYLGGAPILTVPGRTFPVRTKFLEDAIEVSGYSLNDRAASKQDDDEDDFDYESSAGNRKPPLRELAHLSPRTRKTIHLMNEYRVDFDLVFHLIKSIAYGGDYVMYSKAILVFCPGIAEIRRLNDMLQGHPLFPAKEWVIFPMHSSISSEDQERAFDTFPAPTRKIVLATNIAETGITIPDITCVIDLGKHKEMRFDERRQLSRLIEAFISRANAKQRRGRAGRVQEGICFHLLTKFRHDSLLAEHQTPEMLRLSLQELVLRVKTCNLGGIEETLLQALDPPSAKNVKRAIDSLIDVKALTPAEVLTSLGDRLARLPLDVHLGKLILFGCIFQCVDVCVTIAAILSSKSPFPTSISNRAQAEAGKLAFKRGDSDLLTVYNAYCAWRNVCERAIYPGEDVGFCRRMNLSPITLAGIEDLKQQLYSSVVDAGFMSLSPEERTQLNNARYQYGARRRFFRPPQAADCDSGNDLLTTSVIAWAFYPKILTRDGSNSKSWRNVANTQTVALHSSSVNKGISSTLPGSVHYLSYYHIMAATSQILNAHETSPVEDFAMALLCGEAEFKIYSGVIIVDGNRAKFRVDSWKLLLALKLLRTKVRNVLQMKFKRPGKELSVKDRYWMEMWQGMFRDVWQIRVERMKDRR